MKPNRPTTANPADSISARCILGASLLLTMLAGCGGTKITRENCQKITELMPRAEVEQILGPPTQSYQGILTWRGKTSEQRIIVVLDEEQRVSEKTCEGLGSP